MGSKPKRRITPKELERIRAEVRDHLDYERGGSGIIAPMSGSGHPPVFVRDWLALHDRHMDVINQAVHHLAHGDERRALLLLDKHRRKWDRDDLATKPS